MMQNLAKELGVVIPVSFFEEANNAHYNLIVAIDADGIGLYRKSHIPDGPGLSPLIIPHEIIFSPLMFFQVVIMFSSGLPGEVLFQSR